MSHMDIVRRQGPLTSTSAAPFESSYAFVKRSYQEGTQSIGKQAMTNRYLYLGSEGVFDGRQWVHQCDIKLRLRSKNKKTKHVDDSLCYVYNEPYYRFYEVQSSTKEDVDVLEIDAEEFSKYNLNFSRVGMYKDGKATGELSTLRVEDLSGKAVRVGGYIFSIPRNVLGDH
jgi:hypothetical protein